ncbi:MAG: fluoride efflux transporter CrcB [Sulfurimonas sp.]|nr:fluoride efflux transporter CrcB [Sulfurimonas sp.]
MSWQTILAIGSGGFVGAVLRAYLNGLISHRLPHDLPYGTLSVNLFGSFVMGLLMAYFMYTSFFSLHVKSFLSTGLLGALTTYSTFAFESLLLLQGGHIALAALNVTLNAVGTILMAGGGFYAGKYLIHS